MLDRLSYILCMSAKWKWFADLVGSLVFPAVLARLKRWDSFIPYVCTPYL